VGHFLDYSVFVAADGSDLYVYGSGLGCGDEIFVCSPARLNKRQISKAAKAAMDNQKEATIVEALKDGASPAQVWNDFGFSARDIGHIAKKNDVKLPRNWFADALRNTNRGRATGETTTN
jgi:hypothetical protein